MKKKKKKKKNPEETVTRASIGVMSGRKISTMNDMRWVVGSDHPIFTLLFSFVFRFRYKDLVLILLCPVIFRLFMCKLSINATSNLTILSHTDTSQSVTPHPASHTLTHILISSFIRGHCFIIYQNFLVFLVQELCNYLLSLHSLIC